MITIVPVLPEHLPLLARIGRTTLLESHGHSAAEAVMLAYVDAKFSEAALAEELADPAAAFHLIYVNGEPAGYSKILHDQPIDPVPLPHLTKLERLYLLKEYYGQPLGHELMTFNMDLSRRRGQQGMWLYVWKENSRAIRFYERAGFRIVGDGWFRLTADHANPNWQMALTY